MRNIYYFPLVGAIITLLGLCFPVVSIYDGITLWSWGFYTVENKSSAYFRINNEKEFETAFSIMLNFSSMIFLFMLFSLIIIVQISIKVKRKRISVNEAKTQWDQMSFAFLLFLVIYIISITSIEGELNLVNYKIGLFIQILGGFICIVSSLSRLKKFIIEVFEAEIIS